MSRILVVDDEPGVLRVIQLTLEDYGHQVVATEDPETVMGLVQDVRPDAVILDVMMPGVSGWEILQAIRKDASTERLPVVMLSALGEVEHRVRGLRQGADDYIKKPFDPEELVARVEGLIARKPATVAGLEGTLEIQSFAELIQSLDQGAKTGALKIRCGERYGRVELVSGRLAKASLDHLAGRQAVLALVELSSGSFSFQPSSKTAVEGADWPDPTKVQPLLLEAAWLRDSLEPLADNILPEDQPLQASRPLPEIPEELEGLPFEPVLRALEERPQALSEILEGLPEAPNRVRLSLAWMCKEGVVEPSPDAGGSRRRVSETLDAAVREFLQTAVFQGYSLDGEAGRGVRIAFYVTEPSWDSLASLLLSLPKGLLASSEQGRMREVFLHRGGSLVLNHESG
ncbi:MAG: response regulator, partial [Acidobacteria bacterium]|nr:response regulator [Acidobacteriota bacterium]